MDFEIIGEIKDIQSIVVGRGVHDRTRLNKLNTIHKAEVHWYEAHGIGRRELKLKLPLLD